MQTIPIKSVILSAVIVWVLGVIAFIASYFVPVMPDPDVQANWVLSVAIIPFATLGAHIYYRKGHQTNGFLLGVVMFLVAMVLDAIITVPVLVIPNGGSYLSFFTDAGFWLIAVTYVSVVAAYWQIEKAIKRVQLRKANAKSHLQGRTPG